MGKHDDDVTSGQIALVFVVWWICGALVAHVWMWVQS